MKYLILSPLLSMHSIVHAKFCANFFKKYFKIYFSTDTEVPIGETDEKVLTRSSNPAQKQFTVVKGKR